MARKQKTITETQAAIFRREHRKSPLRGGVKLTLKKARELALQEFGTAKGIQREENALPDYYIMRLGNMRVRIAPDTYGGTSLEWIRARLSASRSGNPARRLRGRRTEIAKRTARSPARLGWNKRG